MIILQVEKWHLDVGHSILKEKPLWHLHRTTIGPPMRLLLLSQILTRDMNHLLLLKE